MSGILGNQGPGSDTFAPDFGATWFVLSEDGVIGSIFAYCESFLGTEARTAIYEYSPGSQIKVQSESVTLNATGSWHKFPLTNPVFLSAGSYAIAIESQDSITVYAGSARDRSASASNTCPTFVSGWP